MAVDGGEVGVWGLQRGLLGVGRVVEHLADGLDDGVTVDAVDLQQLVGLAAAGGVGHGQPLQGEAGLIDHCRGHGLPKTTCQEKVRIRFEVEMGTQLSP